MSTNTNNLLIDDDGNIFSTEDGLFLSFTVISGNIRFLEKEIHASPIWNISLATSFRQLLADLIDLLPTTNSQNFHAASTAIREFNRKCHNAGLFSSIMGPHDAGFRPLSLGIDSIEDSFLLLEGGIPLQLENGFELVLEG
jgi:hypothetical protein